MRVSFNKINERVNIILVRVLDILYLLVSTSWQFPTVLYVFQNWPYKGRTAEKSYLYEVFKFDKI